ncbi:MAG: putative bifunctional diguanylate cyclase/phosphodiesterase [Xenococcaceae cyanobacterium]
MSKLLRVLIVEDSEDDAELLAIELERGGYRAIYERVETHSDMQTALKEQIHWDIILADYALPHFSAIAALDLLKDYQLDLPFIIVSGKIGEDTAIAAMKAGAHDYLLKGKLARLVPAVEREIREALLRQEHRQAQERLKYLAYYDDLTTLPNRTLFLECLKEQISKNKLFNASNSAFAVLSLNMDRFRIIKYSLGHSVSEQLLIAAAKRIKKCLKERDILARINADEFAIILTNVEGAKEVEKKAEEIYAQFLIPFKLQETVVFTTVSIGIVLSDIGYEQPEKLLQAADTAMHYAKFDALKNLVFFHEVMYTLSLKRIQLESDLQQAISEQKLHLNYQPIVSLSTGTIDSFEALVRWEHPSLGLITPENFISLSEETGLIIPLGKWVLKEACQQLVNWKKNSNRYLPLSISVNVSGIQLSHPKFLWQIDRLIQSLQINGKYLKLEITESNLMENSVTITKVLEKLKERGIKLCIDDFGTGYSSLSYLRYLPIDTVKIDRSFIVQNSQDPNYDIVKAIVNLAHSLRLDVIAEGIETEIQLDILRSLGCKYGQGYLFASPLNNRDALQLMKHGLKIH